MNHKCSFDGVTIKPDGIHEIDPCVYEDIKMYSNVTVIISRCKNCGHIEVSWMRQDDTEEIFLEDGNGDERID
jgi:hypothetical protein